MFITSYASYRTLRRLAKTGRTARAAQLGGEHVASHLLDQGLIREEGTSWVVQMEGVHDTASSDAYVITEEGRAYVDDVAWLHREHLISRIIGAAGVVLALFSLIHSVWVSLP